MQPAVVSNLPPDNARPGAFERDPGGDVGLVIQIADDNFGPGAKRLPDREADRPDERRRIQSECNLVGRAGVDERGNRLARTARSSRPLPASGRTARRAARCARSGGRSPRQGRWRESARRRHCRKTGSPLRARAPEIRGGARRLERRSRWRSRAPSHARIRNRNDGQKREKRRHGVLQPVHEKGRHGNRGQRHDPEDCRGAVRWHPDRQTGEPLQPGAPRGSAGRSGESRSR